MRRVAVFTVLITATLFGCAGCESHQSKVDALQKEHERLSRQYQKDCGSEYLKAKPEFSQKCADEAKQMDEAWKKLEAEHAKN